MKITVLVDNNESKGWHSEHGLALLLEHLDGYLLFDTGAGKATPFNLIKAGFRPELLKMIVLSHGHYDHTGGLSDALLRAGKTEIFCGVDITKTRFSLHPGMPVKNLTMPESSIAALRSLPSNQVHWIKTFSALNANIFVTGAIARHSFEDCGGPFFLDREGTRSDLIDDEIALLTRSGILIQGCCHAGIINTVEHCKHNRPEINIRIIIGGLHLLHASKDRLKKTAEYLNSMNLEKLILLHCTGAEAADYLKKHLLCDVVIGRTGDVYEQ